MKFTKLKVEYKKTWVNALRSGNYKQCKNTLIAYNMEDKPDSYCCLGVLGHLFNEEAPNNTYTDIYKASGLLKEDAYSTSDQSSAITILTFMNDGRNGYEPHNFNQIADWIEENL